MSTVNVTDRRGGVYEVVITYSYGECARLPFNSLRKVNARIDQIRDGGLKATAQFNLRNSVEAANFVEVLYLFGEDGAFVHGSPADPEELKRDAPDEDAEPGISAATIMKTRPEEPAASSPKQDAGQGSPATAAKAPLKAAKPAKTQEEAEDLEIDDGFGIIGDENWEARADEAVALSLAEHENKAETMSRVAKVAGDRYTEEMARKRMIALLWEKFQDEAYVAAFLKRRDWENVTEDEVRRVAS